MILKKIYTVPKQLFEPIEFVEGINFIFGKKSSPKEPKKSLNAIGKSTFLDLLDFALLASYQKQHSPRLYAAYQKGLLKNISVVLEFEINYITYVITRSFDKPNLIFLSENNQPSSPISLDDCKKRLCDLIFYKKNYTGFYSNTWLRKLLPFYLKIQKPKKEKFLDPIQYIKELPLLELNQYNLFLLDINNTLAHSNFDIQVQKKKIIDTLTNVEEFVSDNYELNDIPDAISKARILKIEIDELKKSIKDFTLSQHYKVDEEKANKLTGEIKELWFNNHSDRKKIDDYRESLKDNIEISTLKIKRLYSDLNSLLANNIKKSLDEAIEFKKELIASRKEFVSNEIFELEHKIQERDSQIKKLEEERRTVFNFLSSEKAIDDLTEAFRLESNKSKELADIESQIKLYQDLTKEKNRVERQEKETEGKILEFIEKIEDEDILFSKLFKKIYNSLYPELSDPSIFNISHNLDTDAKIQINVLPNTEMFSKGRNQGRTLIYDLAVLLSSIEKNINAPRFLVHDGIFDGMDKAHFIALYEFLEEQRLQGKRFQYIMTYNEEGTLTDNFGNADKVTTEKIEDEAILVLTPKKKLLGDF